MVSRAGSTSVGNIYDFAGTALGIPVIFPGELPGGWAIDR